MATVKHLILFLKIILNSYWINDSQLLCKMNIRLICSITETSKKKKTKKFRTSSDFSRGHTF